MTFLPFILQALALYRLCLARGPGRVADSVTAFLMLIDVATAFISEGPRWPSAASWGMSLALACDLIVAADDARFVMSYARVGLSPDG